MRYDPKNYPDVKYPIHFKCGKKAFNLDMRLSRVKWAFRGNTVALSRGEKCTICGGEIGNEGLIPISDFVHARACQDNNRRLAEATFD